MPTESSLQNAHVRGVLHEPDSPNGQAILLTHGAGSGADSPLLVAFARDFAAAGYLVLRYDLPFRFGASKGPLNEAAQARDREGIRHAIDAVRPRVSGRIAAGGHSYGGRQTAMAAAADPGLAAALLLLSYPLHPPDKPQQLRTSFFPELRTPTLFVHGTRDPFGTIEELRGAVRAIPARTEILEVDRAAHDLKRAVKLGGTILEYLNRIAGTL
jgi:predicted alpha/beta-hydrolase family hydrolase